MTITLGKRSPAPVAEPISHKKARLYATRRDEEKPETAAKVDLTYGQRSAFPGLEDDGDEGEDMFYGPADDGLAYLRMVRLEAKGVPNLLVAPTIAEISQEKDPYAPYEPRGEGFYSDGAYVAVPSKGPLDKQHENSETDPQEAYYIALLERFEDLRATLSATPSSSAPRVDSAVQSLLGKPRPSPWKHALLKSQPTPVLLCSLPNENTIFGIEVLESLLTTKNLKGGVRQRLGAWTWGLLGRCRGVSEMDSEDVSVLRGLGKKACALLRRLQAGEEVDEEDENGGMKEHSDGNTCAKDTNENGDDNDSQYGKDVEIDDGEHGESVNGNTEKICENPIAENSTRTNEFSIDSIGGDPQIEETSLEEARARLLGNLSSAETSRLGHSDDPHIQPEPADLVEVSDAHAMLDMIVTLVGDCYGQRDLLDARLAWEEL